MWEDLSDDELLARLVYRGVPYPDACLVVGARDHERAARFITDTLERRNAA